MPFIMRWKRKAVPWRQMEMRGSAGLALSGGGSMSALTNEWPLKDGW